MIYAVYRVLYGEDFLIESIKSVISHVDHVFIFINQKPFGNVTECEYKGKTVKFPNPIDNVCEKLDHFLFHNKQYRSKIARIADHSTHPKNQFTKLVNTHILNNSTPKPDYIIFMEHDHIWDSDQLFLAFREMKKKDHRCASSAQIEHWKHPQYVIPKRLGRLGSVFWKVSDLDKIPETGFHANISSIKFLSAPVHNMGFCMSPENMFWKHMLALGFSRVIGDSEPNEDWFTKWLTWRPDYNNKNLEISKGHEYTISHAYEDIDTIPDILRNGAF